MSHRSNIREQLLDFYYRKGPNNYIYAQNLRGYSIENRDSPSNRDFLTALQQLLVEGGILGITDPNNQKVAVCYNPQRVQLRDAVALSSKQPIAPSDCDVFISYSTRDFSIAEEMANELRSRGLNVFLSHQTVTVGPKWEDQVADAARSCRIAVLIVSRQSRDSDWVRYEIGALWALGKHVAPALVGLESSELPELLRKYQARPADSPQERQLFCAEVARLLAKK